MGSFKLKGGKPGFRTYSVLGDLSSRPDRYRPQEKKPSTRKHPKPTKPIGRGFA